VVPGYAIQPWCVPSPKRKRSNEALGGDYLSIGPQVGLFFAHTGFIAEVFDPSSRCAFSPTVAACRSAAAGCGVDIDPGFPYGSNERYAGKPRTRNKGTACLWHTV
jgi:hypothetical protein